MRLVFAGTPEPAVVALEKLLSSEHDVVAVITRPDARRGRGRGMHPSPVKALAESHGIEVLTPATLKADTEDGIALRNRLKELNVDAIPVVAYGNLVPADLLEVAPHGWVNLHFSLLPQWRGAAPVQAAIRAGDDITGATTFRIEEGLDTGPILGSVTEEIRDDDNADDLLTRLAYSGADLLAATMDGLAEGVIVPQQQEGVATHAEKIAVADARVDWSQPALAIDRSIRAHTPGPGAWTMWGEQRVKLSPVKISDFTSSEGVDRELAPGTTLITKTDVWVGTGSRPVRLQQVQPVGKKMMNAADWARGLGQKANEVIFS